MFPIKFLPSLVGVSPVVLLTGFIFSDQTAIQPPASISGQVWLVSVVVAAMGLTRIVMWVRGGGKDEHHKETEADRKSREEDRKEFRKILDNHSNTLEKIVEIQTRIVDSQKQLADTQSKALDLYAKVSENMAVFRVQLENHNDIAMSGFNELKATLRDKNETS